MNTKARVLQRGSKTVFGVATALAICWTVMWAIADGPLPIGWEDPPSLTVTVVSSGLEIEAIDDNPPITITVKENGEKVVPDYVSQTSPAVHEVNLPGGTYVVTATDSYGNSRSITQTIP